MNSHVKDTASDMAHQVASSPKVQGAISAGLSALGGYNLVEAATSVLSLVSLVVGICVGLFALVNAHKASKKADIELYLLGLQKDAANVKEKDKR